MFDSHGTLRTGLPKVGAAGDRLLTVPEVLDLTPELGLVRDLSEALARRSPLYGSGYELAHWRRTSPRKFFIRKT